MRLISSHSVLLLRINGMGGPQTWMTEESTERERRACNKVNRMEHVFANAVAAGAAAHLQSSAPLTLPLSPSFPISPWNTNTYTLMYTLKFSIFSLK